MNSLVEYYKILGVSIGAGIADVTLSYRRLCRIYHPDVSDDPESEDLMKRINIAYTTLREKLRQEAISRGYQYSPRSVGKNGNTGTYNEDTHKADTHNNTASTRANNANPYTETRAKTTDPHTDATAANADTINIKEEREALTVLQKYFKAISIFDYSGAYMYLCSYDKKNNSCESFIEWRKSVARVFPIRGFQITGGKSVVTVQFKDGMKLCARKFCVTVTEDDIIKGETRTDNVEKLVIYENGFWKIFLGYNGVGELTHVFDERYEDKLKSDAAKSWEEYYAGLYPEYNMLSLIGMRKAAAREIYRQKRLGGTLTFAAISIQACQTGDTHISGQEELLRSAAKTMTGTLRETDIPAYAGDGVFAILLIGLRKKNTEGIISRLIERIRRNAGTQLGARADIEYTFETWSNSDFADIDILNSILKRYHKKM
jgi:hypothetical protein